jgi:MoaA/NifB/PqqE/SkfB family radical SAM enzyme
MSSSTRNPGDPLLAAFSRSVVGLFRDALRISLRQPAQAAFLVRTARWQRQAVARRADWEERGVHVPPFMICSVTNRCNLNCAGCYNKAQHRSVEGEMTEAKLREVLAEASELGISIALLAGGEPLIREDLLRVVRAFPHIVFPVFTNGLLIDDRMIQELKGRRNLVPVLSIEGHAGETDHRRGCGVGERLAAITSRLAAEQVFYGVSFTANRNNLETLLDEAFLREEIRHGCKLFFFIEYVPVQPGTEDLVLTEGQRARLIEAAASLRERLPAIFIAFPGDEEAMGGCLAAGRGFIHISARGDVEPCPFAPYSDASLRDMTIREALNSPLLRAIRENSDGLHDVSGGCALWNKRGWVEAKLRESQRAGGLGQA